MKRPGPAMSVTGLNIALKKANLSPRKLKLLASVVVIADSAS